MNPSSQDTITDTLTLFSSTLRFSNKTQPGGLARPSQKKKKVEYSLWRGGVGGSKERRLPKKGEGDSTQALNVLEDCEIKNKILTFPSPTTLWYYA